MSQNDQHNGWIPTDPAVLFTVILTSFLLVKSLTTEEVQNLATLLPVLFAALPLVRR